MMMCVADASALLREVMSKTGTSQQELARLSGVRQPSISQFLSGRVGMSDEMVDRLLSCMGFRLEVVRRPVRPTLTRSSHRSWALHRELARRLTPTTLEEWVPTVARNLDRLRSGVRGEPHSSNLERWQRLIDDRDIPGLRRVLTGVDTSAIEMREVSPLGGLLSDVDRRRVMGALT